MPKRMRLNDKAVREPLPVAGHSAGRSSLSLRLWHGAPVTGLQLQATASLLQPPSKAPHLLVAACCSARAQQLQLPALHPQAPAPVAASCSTPPLRGQAEAASPRAGA